MIYYCGKNNPGIIGVEQIWGKGNITKLATEPSVGSGSCSSFLVQPCCATQALKILRKTSLEKTNTTGVLRGWEN